MTTQWNAGYTLDEAHAMYAGRKVDESSGDFGRHLAIKRWMASHIAGMYEDLGINPNTHAFAWTDEDMAKLRDAVKSIANSRNEGGR